MIQQLIFIIRTHSFGRAFTAAKTEQGKNKKQISNLFRASVFHSMQFIKKPNDYVNFERDPTTQYNTMK